MNVNGRFLIVNGIRLSRRVTAAKMYQRESRLAARQKCEIIELFDAGITNEVGAFYWAVNHQ